MLHNVEETDNRESQLLTLTQPKNSPIDSSFSSLMIGANKGMTIICRNFRPKDKARCKDGS